MHRRRWNASRKTGFVSTVSAIALMVRPGLRVITDNWEVVSRCDIPTRSKIGRRILGRNPERDLDLGYLGFEFGPSAHALPFSTTYETNLPPMTYQDEIRALILFIEPGVFHAPIIDDAVCHHRPPLHLGLPAVREAVVKNDRPRTVLRQLSLNLPYELLAFPRVGFHRLPVEQPFELGIAIAGIIARRTTGIALVELLVWVVNAAAGAV